MTNQEEFEKFYQGFLDKNKGKKISRKKIAFMAWRASALRNVSKIEIKPDKTQMAQLKEKFTSEATKGSPSLADDLRFKPERNNV